MLALLESAVQLFTGEYTHSRVIMQQRLKMASVLILSGTSTSSYASSPVTPNSPGLLASADLVWTQQDTSRDLSTSAVRQAHLSVTSAPGVTPALVREQAVQYKTCMHLRTEPVDRVQVLSECW